MNAEKLSITLPADMAQMIRNSAGRSRRERHSVTPTLTYSVQAQADLEGIFDFIALDNPRRARTRLTSRRS